MNRASEKCGTPRECGSTRRKGGREAERNVQRNKG